MLFSLHNLTMSRTTDFIPSKFIDHGDRSLIFSENNQRPVPVISFGSIISPGPGTAIGGFIGGVNIVAGTGTWV